MLRVNQAGEYGATRIYAGQLAVLSRSSATAHQVARMAAQEKRQQLIPGSIRAGTVSVAYAWPQRLSGLKSCAARSAQPPPTG